MRYTDGWTELPDPKTLSSAELFRIEQNTFHIHEAPKEFQEWYAEVEKEFSTRKDFKLKWIGV